MFINKEEFKVELIESVASHYKKSLEQCTNYEKYEAVVHIITKHAQTLKNENDKKINISNEKKVYYFSMEFLIGKLLENYLINLGIKDEVEQGLCELGVNLKEICEEEKDPGLGNGGLGRLAACFLDSMASLGIHGNGIGLRYRFGLFKQKIVDGKQVEEPDAWLENGYPWEKAKPDRAVEVRFGGYVDRQYKNGEMTYELKDYNSLLATPYDIPIIGYEGEKVNTLRLYNAGLYKDDVDIQAFNKGDYGKAFEKQCEAEALTSILYPDDSLGVGKKLRLKQEYFMVCAGIANIVKDYEYEYGENKYEEMGEHISIHINDTHPALCVPELMRILIDEKGLSWDKAWKITTSVMSFTNHTVLPEALEKWPISLFKSILPRVYMIVEEIHRRWREKIEAMDGDTYNLFPKTAILWDGEVRMANLSIIGSHSVNGVAALHTKILIDSVFNEFYKISPEKFNNKTNGVTQRRFLIQANPNLTNLVTDKIGNGWLKDMTQIGKLLEYKEDESLLSQLREVKRKNKIVLAKYIKDTTGIEVDENSIFDIQVKRIHAYKRQLLNALKILNLYNEIKANPELDIFPTTFIFAGKAAQGYAFAKETIEFINSIAELVNEDEIVSKKIKVVYIENFCVSNAGLIYPAADISEQISTAGKEASGTGNMKFMMNGAITLGTLDGANVEIKEQVGEDNIKIFGYNADETMNFYFNGGYNANEIANNDPRIVKMKEQMITGELPGEKKFWGIYDEILTHNDTFFVLGDFNSYMNAWKDLNNLYKDEIKWGKISLENIAKSAFFSSDRVIKEYADEIWEIKE